VVDVVALGAVVVVIGLALVVIEAHVSTAGVLGLGGALAAVAGIGVILAGSGTGLVVAIPVSVVLGVACLLVGMVATHKIRAARVEAVQTGPETLIGSLGTVRTWSGDEGQVAADGTLWSARRSLLWNDPPPTPGEKVIISELVGLTVSVRRPYPWEVAPVWTPSSLSL
jgi:membrane-bound serine protease (ClpP class)